MKTLRSRDRSIHEVPASDVCAPVSEKGRKAKLDEVLGDDGDPISMEPDSGFATPIAITKSEAIKRFVSVARRAHLDYEGFRYAAREARKRLGLQRTARPRKLPHLLTPDELRAFFTAVDAGGDLRHRLMLRLLFVTGVRVRELVHIKRGDVDLDHATIRIESGKGGKDRHVLFPEGLRLGLSAYMAATVANTFLFETRHAGAFTTRRVEQIVAAYGCRAKLDVRVHPHLFRHQALTELTRAGLTDAQVQLVSGHASKKSLEVYQHLGLSTVTADYQRAMRDLLP